MSQAGSRATTTARSSPPTEPRGTSVDAGLICTRRSGHPPLRGLGGSSAPSQEPCPVRQLEGSRGDLLPAVHAQRTTRVGRNRLRSLRPCAGSEQGGGDRCDLV